ncbi:hypothetical protein FSP39_010669 [Pinctada imbricata]|uniref:NAD(+) kinase n=1 Tax=Pinctada imbricata TaxID=66713 RepID=A0AA88Y095_PINIB|nr:hypothetical protein FSP39_010669 [Pinctada imbricata]
MQKPIRSLQIKRFMCDVKTFFKPKRAVVLSKMTRYEFEKRTHKDMSEDELRIYLQGKRSDYEKLVDFHKNHKKCLEIIETSFKRHGIEAKIVDRFHFNADLIEWADVVFTAGGDGTYLLAASKIDDSETPLIGINTDPLRSEGYLCLPKLNYSGDKFEAALKRILDDGKSVLGFVLQCLVTMRTMSLIELHDQQLHFPEHRFTEHVMEHVETSHSLPRNINESARAPRVLPVKALNEVFIGESLSSRVSYYETKLDNTEWHKQKSSGLTVCTGTGSTSWFFHIHQISNQTVQQILQIANDITSGHFPVDDVRSIKRIASQFNNSFTFDASDLKMAYTTRDPINNVRSRMWDACLVVDGGSSFRFNDGAVATMEILEEDSLRTIIFD